MDRISQRPARACAPAARSAHLEAAQLSERVDDDSEEEVVAEDVDGRPHAEVEEEDLHDALELDLRLVVRLHLLEQLPDEAVAQDHHERLVRNVYQWQTKLWGTLER